MAAGSHGRAYHAYRTTALPAYDRITPENSPSNVAAANHPFDHLISAEAVVSAESKACAAPVNTELEPAKAWEAKGIERSARTSCAHANPPRRLSRSSRMTK